MVIQQATILERPQIEAMARLYFQRMGREYQDRTDTHTWFVAREGELVAGCYSMQIYPETSQIWLTDMYRIDGRQGAKAIAIMWRNAYYAAKQMGFDIVITCDPKNTQWVRFIERYGDVDLVGLVYLHKT